ncbi:ABC transporter ATP-binding protein [Pseudanabaena sp. FACHB-2040]|uniref:ABC transporter ATP-binding protein n=1 Tax=Pseudanabaena sp. FACHB-2040 TaxID=2692859 RepID=UPI00168429DF|nr:ABC transporter ATP-binding protein [Pseudanabaena sp. FACHB-2040]MBD2260160.1 ABC transporter ATP-binding protein [Pseudanabaena sp. FACHB-2040]
MSQTTVSRPPTGQTNASLDVELRQVFKIYGGEPAVRGIDLEIRQGEFFSILGPSGCGKTTTLRLIAGFEAPSTGEVIIQGRDMSHVPSYRRPVNTVFQSYALFGHMTVWDNIAFGLRIKRLSKSQVHERVAEALRLVQMEAFAKRSPTQLSGGQQQRVALARALVNRPAVMLLDEPLGALDLKLRKQMQVELSNLHRKLGITFIMVTHDQEEALSLSDRIAVMNAGQIEQVGTPSEIYDSPQTPFVADFIGDTNLIEGQLEPLESSVQVTTQSGLKLLVDPPDFEVVASKTAVISIRPEKIHLSLTPPDESQNCFVGEVSHVMYLGTHIHCMVQLQTGEQLTVLQPNRAGSMMVPQTTVYAYWRPKDCLVLEMA